MTDFIFLGSKITAFGDCSHEIKRHLFLGRRVMTNLDGILKSRDIILPTKVCLVKAVVFPVVTYGCESWTIKEAGRIDAFKLWCWSSLWSQGTLKCLLQHHSSKASILWPSAFFRVQLSHPYRTTGKTIALTRWPFVGK